MAINIYKVKKTSGLLIMGFFPFFLFYLLMMFQAGVLYSILGMIVGLLIGLLFFNILTKHPILQMLEGEGLLVFTLDSTGVIDTFIVKNPNPPKLTNQERGIETIFDRKTIFQLNIPKPAELFTTNKQVINSQGVKCTEQIFKIQEQKSDIQFGFNSFPVLIYNKNLKLFMTKSSLANIEESGIIKHLVIYLKTKIEELTSVMRDFARYVVEQTRPKNSFQELMGKWWVWLIIIGMVALALYMFAPAITGTTSGFMDSLGGAVQT